MSGNVKSIVVSDTVDHIMLLDTHSSLQWVLGLFLVFQL